MNNFYLIDKPSGITSFDVLRKLKKILNIKKMGHTGTLDPLASGLLFVAVGNYTKLIPFFEKDKKTYEFIISLDGTTPSFDKETEITFLDNEKINYYKKNLKLETIQELIKNKFSGEIYQLPPKYSALKINGKKALDMVREGTQFELKERKTTIYNIDIIDFNYPEIKLIATVSAGTYIRSIASDLGNELGTGGYITYLRRTKIGDLSENKSIKLQDFDLNNFLDEKEIFKKYNFLKINELPKEDLDNGKQIKNDLNIKKDGIYFVLEENKIAYIIEKKDDFLKSLRKI